MQHLCSGSRRHPLISEGFLTCQDQVRFFALHRVKPHAPPLVRVPVNSFEFQPCGRTPQADNLTRSLRHREADPPNIYFSSSILSPSRIYSPFPVQPMGVASE